MSVDTPMCQTYIDEVIFQAMLVSKAKMTAVCSTLQRQLRVAGRDRKEAHKMIHLAVVNAKKKLGKGGWDR